MLYQDDKEEEDRLLRVDEEPLEPTIDARSWTGPWQSRWLMVHGLLILLETTLLLSILVISSRDAAATGTAFSEFGDRASEIFTPASPAVKYTVLEPDGLASSLFVGEPRPELDQAWSRLLRSGIMRFSENDFKKINISSVELQDGSGYIGTIEVNHQLHCIKRLYQFQYPDYYPEFMEDGQFPIEHWAHCLEVLRQGVMCNADTAIRNFHWVDGHRRIKLGDTGHRRCVDYERLQAWAEERIVPNDLSTFVKDDNVAADRYA